MFLDAESTTEELRVESIKETSDEAEDPRNEHDAAHEDMHFKAWGFAFNPTAGLKRLKDGALPLQCLLDLGISATSPKTERITGGLIHDNGTHAAA